MNGDHRDLNVLQHSFPPRRSADLNGAGKTSLLKVIAGNSKLDDYTVWRAPSVRIAYVPQEPVLNPAHSVFEAVAEGLGNLQKLLVDYHTVSDRKSTRLNSSH